MKNVLENLSKNLEKIKEKKDAKEKKIKEALEKQAKQQKLEQIEKAEAQAKLKKKLAEKLENVVDKIGDSIIENTAEPIIENTAEPIIENTAEPIIENTAEPIIENTAEPIIENTAEPIIENTAEPIIENTPLIEDKIEPKKDESYLVEGLDFGATKKPKEPNLEVHESLKDILTPAQIAALNSGITEADVESISGKADKTEIPSVRTIQTSLAAAMSMADGGADPVAGGSSDVDLSNYYSKTEADSLLSKKADKSALNNYALKSALNSKVDSSSVYTKDEVDTKLNTKANSSAVYNKTQVDSKLSTKVESTELANYAKKTDLNAKADTTSVYTKTEIDKKLDALSAGDIDLSTYATKVELSTGLSTKVEKTELSDYAKTTDVNTGLALKADKSDTYNKKEVDDLVAAASGTDMSAYATKTELNTKANSADVYKKTETYNQTEIDSKLATKLTSADLTNYVTQTTLNDALSTYATDDDLNTEITKTTTKITTLDTKVSDFITNVQGVQTNLNAKDTELSNAIDAINAKIPNTASNTNQLADKDYVKDLVQKNAARGLSANASGDSFTSKAALESGPWYYQGTQLTAPHQNDYAIVTADALNDGNDVRYNYDGAGWVKFQVYQSGAGFDPSTTQLAAINSGITSTEVAQISTNKTDIAAEKTARETADTGLLAKITAEQTARESGDNDIKDTYIGALGSLTTTDKTSVVSGINSLKTELNDSKVSKAGDTMTGTLKVSLPTSGDLIYLESQGKGATFSMDGNTGYMHIIPVSAPTTGFEISANTLMPRTNAMPYNLGGQENTWDNGYIENLKEVKTLNGTDVTELVVSVAQVKQLIIDLEHPIGSVIHSFDYGYDPNDVYTGTTWEKIKEGIFLEATEAADTAGTEKEAGLPNITGEIAPFCTDTSSGAFYLYGGSNGWVTAGPYAHRTAHFDASRSSAVYGKSDTVQPHSITCFIWRRTA